MLDINDVGFRQELDIQPNTVRVIGGIKLSADCYGVSDEIDMCEDHIRQAIWHEVYGDLKKPIAELQHFALQCHEPGVKELCEQLNALLEFKTAKPKS